MCGIFGYAGTLNKDLAERCLLTLAHRGPDGSGLVEYPGATLGHRRLSILDLSTKGAQPMEYLDRYSITFNGEIYNFIEIRKELQDLGYTFQSDSDTEVILAAYHEWHEKCLDKFNGMWAFGIWDNQESQLFLSRDRFGKKPLFYTELGNDLAFASEMKALAPLLKTITPNTKLIKDLEHIFYYESTDKCLIEEIKRFPAGHYGYFKEGKLTLTRFWNTLDHIVPITETYEEQVEHLRKLFLDACAIRMRSDVTLGTALSGGLDSSAVFGAVSHLSKEGGVERGSSDWQHSFVASFPNTPVDETAFAKKVANHLHAPLEEIVIDPLPHMKDLSKFNYLFEDMYITSPIPFMAVYGKMKEKGVKVTLDGHGADELFGGYSFDFLHIIHDELFNPKAIKEVLDAYYSTKIEDPQFKKENRFVFATKQITRNLAKRILGKKNHSRDEDHPNWSKLDYFTQKLYISSHETVLPTLLRNYDRYSMANSVEIRMPFMDHRIVTYALSLPWQSKIRMGFTKAIVRDVAAPFIPHDVAYRKTKIGFNSPMTDWLKGPLKPFILDTVNSKAFSDSQFVDAEKIKAMVNTVIEDPDATFHEGEAIWKEMAPFFWEQDFLSKIK